ncbi:HAD family hydrolase, partial [Staphylococcus epidermidis]
RPDLNIKIQSLNRKKLKHIIPHHHPLLIHILKQPPFFTNLHLIPHPQQLLKQLNHHYHIYIPTPPIDLPTSFHHKYQSLLQ